MLMLLSIYLVKTTSIYRTAYTYSNIAIYVHVVLDTPMGYLYIVRDLASLIFTLNYSNTFK